MKLVKIITMSPSDLKSIITFINLPKGKNLMDLLNKLISNLEAGDMKYENLFDIAAKNLEKNIDIDIENEIDDLVFDAFDTYYNVKDILKASHKEYEDIEGLDMMWEFVPLYEKILTVSKFTKPKTITIQKMFLQTLLDKEILNENYEYCSEIQTVIKNL